MAEPHDDDVTRTLPDAPAPGGRGEPPPQVRYDFRGALGKGSGGEVRRAYDQVLRRHVAHKQLHWKASEGAAERFVQESQVTGQLEHPNIVPVYDAGTTDDGRPYFTMREVQGRSLADHLKEGTLPAQAQRLRIFSKVCDGVGFAHARGVVHRDIKPANIMLGDHGEVLVVDWGVAKLLDADDEGSTWGERDPVTSDLDESQGSLTRVGTVIGTPAYMAPEQASGSIADIGPRTDVYALGALLYRLLTDARPFDKGPMLLERVAAGAWVPARQRRPDLSWELDAILQRAMAADPKDRYPSVEALRADVEAWLDGKPVSVARYSLSSRLAKAMARNAQVTLAIAITGGLGAMGLAGAGALYLRDVADARDLALAAEGEANTRLLQSHIAIARMLMERGQHVDARERMQAARSLGLDEGLDLRPLDYVDAFASARWPQPLLTAWSMGVSRDGSVLLLSDEVGFYRADPRTFAELERLDEGPWIALSADEDTVFWADRKDQRWRVFDGGTGDLLASAPAPDGMAQGLLFGGPTLVAAVGGHPTQLIRPGAPPLPMPAFSPEAASDGTRVLYGRDLTGVDIFTQAEHGWTFDGTTGTPMRSWPWHRGAALSPSGDQLVGTAVGGPGVVAYDTATGLVMWSDTEPVEGTWTYDGEDRVIGVHATGCMVRDADTGAVLDAWEWPEPWVRSQATFVFPSRDLLGLLRTGLAQLWPRPSQPWQHRVDQGQGLAWSHDGGLLAIAVAESGIELREGRTGALLQTLPAQGSLRRPAFTPDGTRLWATSSTGELAGFDLTAGTPLPSLPPRPGHGSAIDVDILAGGKRAVVTYRQGPTMQWSLETLGPVGPVASPITYGWSVAADRDTVVVAGRRNQEPLWAVADALTGEIRHRSDEMHPAYGLALHPDAGSFAVTAHDGRVLVVDTGDGGVVQVDQSEAVAFAVDWSSDGALLAAAFLDGQLRIYDTDTWSTLADWSFEGGIADLRFAPGGHRLAILSGRGLSLVDLDHAQQEARWTVPADGQPRDMRAMARAAERRRGWATAARLWGELRDQGLEVDPMTEATALIGAGDLDRAGELLRTAPPSARRDVLLQALP